MKRSVYVFVLNIGHALNHYLLLIFPTVVLTLHSEWNLGYAELLQVGSAAMIIYGVMSLPVGWLADHWSRRGLLIVYFFGIGISALLTSLAQTPVQIGLGLCSIAGFAAIYHPVGIAMVFSSSDRVGRAIAINGFAGNLGLAFAAMGTAYLSQWLSWRAAFYVPALVSLLFGTVFCLVSEETEKLRTLRKTNEEASLPISQLKVLFTCIAVIVFFGGLVFQSTTTSLSKIMDVQFNQSLNLSATVTTTIFISAAFIQLGIGELIDRISIKVLLTSIAGGQLLFLLLATVCQGWILVLVFMGMMLCSYAQIPINDWLIGHYSDAKWRSRIYALKYTLSFSTGPIAYWLIASTYVNTGNFIFMYLTLALGMLLALVAIVFMPSSRKGSTCNA
ncbi:MFS transporter [Vibrio sp. SCSIO 43169]|uniref:MFS transporter n=1 Tax=Vibrio sp. SCSIO 43169 TaxID=2822801 RepID=UPI00204376CA|nr:MFS transporter [Vibrio sp. SCSIO 43169]MCM5511062.1 MFS transporter [Vibrio sp. SCSIO 43169]